MEYENYERSKKWLTIKWFTMYNALNAIYNPDHKNVSKKWVFDRALVQEMITSYAYHLAKAYFEENDSWDH